MSQMEPSPDPELVTILREVGTTLDPAEERLRQELRQLLS